MKIDYDKELRMAQWSIARALGSAVGAVCCMGMIVVSESMPQRLGAWLLILVFAGVVELEKREAERKLAEIRRATEKGDA